MISSLDEKKDLGPLLLAKEKFNFIIKNYTNSDYALDEQYKIEVNRIDTTIDSVNKSADKIVGILNG